MINLMGASIQCEGLTLFPDDGDEKSWYFLPDHPHIAATVDGKAALQLVKYRRLPSAEGPPGGGLLSLDVELGVASQVVERAATTLRAAHPGVDVKLQAVKPDRVSCALRLEGDAKSESPSRAEVPLDPPHRASFERMLTMEATTLFETALNAGAPTGTVEYRLVLSVLRPVIPARLTLDWSRVGQFFAQQPGAGGPLSFAQIEEGVRNLVTAGTIRIEQRAASAADNTAVEAQTLHEAVMMVAAHLFDLGAVSPAAESAAPSVGALPSTERTIMNARSYLRRTSSEGGEVTCDLSQPRVGQLTLSAADTLGAMLAAVPRSDRQSTGLMEEEAPKSFTVKVRAFFPPNDMVRLAEVGLTYGDQRVDLVLDRDTPSADATFSRNEKLGRSYAFRYRALLNGSSSFETPGLSLEAPPRTTENGILVIAPEELYTTVALQAVAMFPFQQYRAAFVDIKIDVAAAAWSTTRTIMVSEKCWEAGVSLVIAKDSTPVIAHRVRHVTPSGEVIEGAWGPTELPVIVVGLPAGAPTTPAK